ncbi:MAG TPA: bifunctional DNA-formamidopyrimidine glycosylase/DNA-(apurinic or apyrimidinic site) lyase [Gaiellaceae bacterium]
MPELPEVESIRRSLEPLVCGLQIARAEILDPRLVQPEQASDISPRLEGERISRLERRGKHLLLRLESGKTLVVHLRMTGSLQHRPKGSDPLPYERARLWLEDGSELAYRDVRRFGTWRLLDAVELESYLAARVGPEPLEPDFSPELLRGRLAGRRTALKAALLDQRTLAGLGNIYVDEALWSARLHPATAAGSLSRQAILRLHGAIRETLELGIARQGATLRDYALPDGESGSMQHEFRVYGRGGEPCERCGTAISKTRIAGRGTWFCPRCQRRRD